MKKVLMGMVFILGLQGMQPIQALSMPRFRMPSIDYNAAKKRLDAAKDGVMKALKTNKREIIIKAVAVLLVALGFYKLSRQSTSQQSKMQSTSQTPVESEDESEEIGENPSEEEKDTPLPSARPESPGSQSDFDLLRARAGFMGSSSPSSSRSSSPESRAISPSTSGVPMRYSGYGQ
ncbi:MAG: hypothetical protein ACD_64C00207G0002 [uncultured bacterium]|nr:MAG: hypothetical protein ACD_64C00207G0002 [uncultured bacterium]